MDENGMIKIPSCNEQHVGKLVSSLGRDVAYLILEGCAHVVFNPGG